MPKKVSKSKAAKVLKAVESAFAPWVETGPGPTVNEYYSESGHPVILWEEGPEEWTMLFTQTDVARKVSAEQGVYVEPVNHVVLGVYPA